MRFQLASIIWLVGIVSLVSCCTRSYFTNNERKHQRLHCNQCSFLNATLVRHILRRHMLTQTWDMFAKSMRNLFQQSLSTENAGQMVAYMTDKKLKHLLNNCATNYSHYNLPCSSDEYEYCRWAVWKWNGQTVQASYTCETENDAYWRTCSYAHGESIMGQICAQTCATDGCNSAPSTHTNSISRTHVLILSMVILAVITGSQEFVVD